MRAITAPPGTVGKLERLEITCKRGFDMSHARLSILSASLLFAACSGGGNEFGGTDPNAGSFDITSQNGLQVTKVAWESAVASGEFSDLGGGFGLSAASPGGVSKATLSRPSGLVAGVMQKIPFGPTVIDCIPPGTITISGEIADPLFQALAANDTFSVLYTMCDEGTGEVVDGLVEFTVGDFTGNLLLGTYMVSMDAVVTDLQVMTGNDAVTSNGDATVTLDTTDAPFVYAGTSGSSMTTDSNSSSETLLDYQSSQTVDGNEQNLPYTLFATGSIESTQLAGRVRYSTPIEFGGEGVDYPSEGVLLVEGSNSSARLTAIDNVNVMIELDVNGDGVVDQTIETTWVDLTT